MDASVDVSVDEVVRNVQVLVERLLLTRWGPSALPYMHFLRRGSSLRESANPERFASAVLAIEFARITCDVGKIMLDIASRGGSGVSIGEFVDLEVYTHGIPVVRNGGTTLLVGGIGHVLHRVVSEDLLDHLNIVDLHVVRALGLCSAGDGDVLKLKRQLATSASALAVGLEASMGQCGALLSMADSIIEAEVDRCAALYETSKELDMAVMTALRDAIDSGGDVPAGWSEALSPPELDLHGSGLAELARIQSCVCDDHVRGNEVRRWMALNAHAAVTSLDQAMDTMRQSRPLTVAGVLNGGLLVPSSSPLSVSPPLPVWKSSGRRSRLSIASPHSRRLLDAHACRVCVIALVLRGYVFDGTLAHCVVPSPLLATASIEVATVSSISASELKAVVAAEADAVLLKQVEADIIRSTDNSAVDEAVSAISSLSLESVEVVSLNSGCVDSISRAVDPGSFKGCAREALNVAVELIRLRRERVGIPRFCVNQTRELLLQVPTVASWHPTMGALVLRRTSLPKRVRATFDGLARSSPDLLVRLAGNHEAVRFVFETGALYRLLFT